MWAERTIQGLATAAVALLIGGCANMAPRAQYDGSWPSAGTDDRERTPKTAVGAGVSPDAYDEALTLVLRGQYPQAETRFADLARAYDRQGDVPLAAESGFWVAHCREKLGRRGDALRAYQVVVDQWPDTPAAAMARRSIQRLTAAPGPATRPAGGGE